MAEPSFTSSRYLAVNATITTVGRGLGVASGFALDALTVWLFGLSRLTDAYFAALTIPFLISSTIDTQAPKILVSFFAQGFETRGRRATWAQLTNLMLVTGALFFVLAAALTAGAWLIMPLQVPGLGNDTVRLAVQLEMILAWIVLTQGLGSVVAGALYADHHYFTTTTSRLTTNVVTIVIAILGYRRFGIHALAFGLLTGSCVQLAFLLCAAMNRGFRFGGRRLYDPSVARLLPLSTYPLLGQALSQTPVFIENFFGSLLGTGALSLVRYANRVIAAIAGVLVGGVITTSLPMLSHYAAIGKLEEMKDALLKTIRFVALLSVPVGLWLIFAGEPIVALAFERGQFTPADSARLALLLAILAPYIFFSRVAGVTEAAFYASLDMRTPLAAIAVFLVTYAVACWTFLGRLGVVAFATAMTVGSAVAAVVMLRLVESRFGPLPWAGSKEFVRRLALATAACVVGFLLGAVASRGVGDGFFAAKLVRLVIVTLSGAATFLGSAIFVRLVDWQYLLCVARQARRSPKAAHAIA